MMYTCNQYTLEPQTSGSCVNASCNIDGTACGECVIGSYRCTTTADEVYSAQCTDGKYGEDSLCKGGDIENNIVPTCGENSGCGVIDCTTLNMVACGVSCVDTQYDSNHCGKCNNKCEAKLVCKKGECVDPECTNGEIRCEDFRSYHSCVNGVWSENTYDCHTFEQCSKENGVLACHCMAGTLKCENDPKGLGLRYKCLDGQWESTSYEKCEDVSCNATGTDCGKCLNGDKYCDIDDKFSYFICRDGQWNRESCGTNEVCEESSVGCMEIQ